MAPAARSRLARGSRRLRDVLDALDVELLPEPAVEAIGAALDRPIALAAARPRPAAGRRAGSSRARCSPGTGSGCHAACGGSASGSGSRPRPRQVTDVVVLGDDEVVLCSRCGQRRRAVAHAAVDLRRSRCARARRSRRSGSRRTRSGVVDRARRRAPSGPTRDVHEPALCLPVAMKTRGRRARRPRRRRARARRRSSC